MPDGEERGGKCTVDAPTNTSSRTSSASSTDRVGQLEIPRGADRVFLGLERREPMANADCHEPSEPICPACFCCAGVSHRSTVRNLVAPDSWPIFLATGRWQQSIPPPGMRDLRLLHTRPVDYVAPIPLRPRTGCANARPSDRCIIEQIAARPLPSNRRRWSRETE